MSAVRATVLGTGSVGKSALTISFLQGAFITEYDPTIEDCYSKLMRLGDQTISLEILDTAGQEEYSALRDSYVNILEPCVFLVLV